MVADSGYLQALPVICIAIGLLGGCGPLVGLCGVLLCCMAISASDVYHLTGDKLRQVCLEQGLDSTQSVRSLRQRFVEHLKSDRLEATGRVDTAQASTMTASESEVGVTVSGGASHGSGVDSPTPVLVELLRQIPSLSSE
jgi:hypothetical protein